MEAHHIIQAAYKGPVVTYAGTTATVLFWGLHVSDLAVIISALASLLGVALQFYVAMHRINRLERASQLSIKRADTAETDADKLTHRMDDVEK